MMWTTRDEISFVRGLGRHRHDYGQETPKGVELKLLKGYLQGAKRRTVWAGIDKEAVLDVVYERLAALKE